MTGFLSKSDLRQLTGAARQGDQVAWLSRGPNMAAIEPAYEDEGDAGFDGLLILPTSSVLPVGAIPTGMDCPVAGVYALFSEDGGLNYIGQSSDIALRIAQHRRAAGRGERWPFTTYAYVEVCEFLIDAVELAHILALRPPENMQFRVSGWEYHEDAVRLLKAAWGEKRDAYCI